MLYVTSSRYNIFFLYFDVFSLSETKLIALFTFLIFCAAPWHRAAVKCRDGGMGHLKCTRLPPGWAKTHAGVRWFSYLSASGMVLFHRCRFEPKAALRSRIGGGSGIGRHASPERGLQTSRQSAAVTSGAHEASIRDMGFKDLNWPRSPDMHTQASNLVAGRQLRGAFVLAGLTQRTLGAALGVDEGRSASRSGATTASPQGSGITPSLSSRCWTMA